jgi:hypothetical protein
VEENSEGKGLEKGILGMSFQETMGDLGRRLTGLSQQMLLSVQKWQQ